MKQNIEWVERRIKLLKVHVQEQRQLLATEKEAYRSQRIVHQRERGDIFFTEFIDRMRWTHLIVRQAEEVTHLAQIYSAERSSLLARQQQEDQQLSQQIEQEKRLYLKR